MKNHPKKFFVKVDPDDPLPAIEYLWEQLTGRPLTEEEREELAAELHDDLLEKKGAPNTINQSHPRISDETGKYAGTAFILPAGGKKPTRH